MRSFEVANFLALPQLANKKARASPWRTIPEKGLVVLRRESLQPLYHANFKPCEGLGNRGYI